MKTLLRITGIFYCSILFYIFFLARRRPHPSLYGHRRSVHLVPLKSKIDFFISPNPNTDWYKWIFYTDLFGNIILFIPFSILLVFAFQVTNLRKVMLISLLTSICVETIQFILAIGVADIDDVILNTTGAFIGILLTRLFRHYFPLTTQKLVPGFVNSPQTKTPPFSE